MNLLRGPDVTRPDRTHTGATVSNDDDHSLAPPETAALCERVSAACRLRGLG